MSAKKTIESVQIPSQSQTVVDAMLRLSKVEVKVLGWMLLPLLSLLSMDASSATYYFHNDHLGTPQVLTDEEQNVVWQGRYDPFGQVEEVVALVEQNLRFPGQYLDRETGLHYNYFRDYDPRNGRYIQSDPTGLSGGYSTYGYSLNSPFLLIDPFGLTPDWVDILNQAGVSASYEINPKHAEGQKYQKGKVVTPLPSNHSELFDRSLPDINGSKDSAGRPMRAFAVDGEGRVCTFRNNNLGAYHLASVERSAVIPHSIKDKDLKRMLALEQMRIKMERHQARRRK